ncbi:MAG TPA: hypothetical protein VKT53_04160 [Candidatus Acidoferrum sp.]|nr:hypothetical protein [Candidatus Acidoferrum sp.]
MASKIDKGRSILNATDETANPYGLILSEKEREVIYGDLTRLENMTSALLNGRTGWKQQVQAAFTTGAECAGAIVVADAVHLFLGTPIVPTIMCGFALLILHKLNLLLTHEESEDTHARRQREDEKEAKERAQYFKDMGAKDLSLEE